jgi:hypothetical protein
VPPEDVTLGGQWQPEVQENRTSLHVEDALGGSIRVLELPHEEGAGPAAGNDGVGSLFLAPLCKLRVVVTAKTRRDTLSSQTPDQDKMRIDGEMHLRGLLKERHGRRPCAPGIESSPCTCGSAGAPPP